MSNDWWSKKLSGAQPQKTAPSSVPPISIPLRFPTPQPTPRPLYTTDRQDRLRDDLPSDAQLTMGEAIKLWKGGEAMKKQGDLTCPECGSGNVFIRTSKASSNTVQGNAPAPRCFECGWNGMYDQASQASWGV
jgi:hypothetical protein